jgi:hypothetical protein
VDNVVPAAPAALPANSPAARQRPGTRALLTLVNGVLVRVGRPSSIQAGIGSFSSPSDVALEDAGRLGQQVSGGRRDTANRRL